MELIAILPYFFPRIGGGETHLRILGSRLVKRHAVAVTALTQGLPGCPQTDEVDGIRIQRWGDSLSDAGQESAYKKFANLVEISAKRSIFYIYFSVGSVFRMENIRLVMEACVRHARPFIVRIPSTFRVTEALTHDDRFRDLLCRANAIIALNDEIEDELNFIGVPLARVFKIPNAVNADLFRPNPVWRDLVRRRLGIGIEDDLVLSVSRFAPKKRIPEIIEDWTALVDSSLPPVASLLFVGGEKHEHERHNYEAVITDQINRIKGIFWVREQPHDDLPPFYSAADLFISYSTQEGMSNALLEAMAAGLVAIAPATSATLKLCEPSCNFIYDPVDKGARLVQLRRALRVPMEERREMGIANAARIATEFTPARMADQFYLLMDQIYHSTAE